MFFINCRPLLLGTLVCLTLSGFLSAGAHAQTTADEARELARLYSAAFDRFPKLDGLNFWVETFESGKAVREIAARFSGSPEFVTKYGNLTDRDFVEQLFRNVLGREGVRSGIEFWLKNLENGNSRGHVLAKFAGSPENKLKTELIFTSMRLDPDGKWIWDAAIGVDADFPVPKGSYLLNPGKTSTIIDIESVVIEIVEDQVTVQYGFKSDYAQQRFNDWIKDSSRYLRIPGNGSHVTSEFALGAGATGATQEDQLARIRVSFDPHRATVEVIFWLKAANGDLLTLDPSFLHQESPGPIRFKGYYASSRTSSDDPADESPAPVIDWHGLAECASASVAVTAEQDRQVSVVTMNNNCEQGDDPNDYLEFSLRPVGVFDIAYGGSQAFEDSCYFSHTSPRDVACPEGRFQVFVKRVSDSQSEYVQVFP